MFAHASPTARKASTLPRRCGCGEYRSITEHYSSSIAAFELTARGEAARSYRMNQSRPVKQIRGGLPCSAACLTARSDIRRITRAVARLLGFMILDWPVGRCGGPSLLSGDRALPIEQRSSNAGLCRTWAMFFVQEPSHASYISRNILVRVLRVFLLRLSSALWARNSGSRPNPTR